jgi:RNA methyltransferase, TrmH family
MGEFMDSDFEIVEGFFSDEFATQKEYNFPYQTVTESELARITTLTSNDSGVLIVRMKYQKSGLLHTSQWQSPRELILILDRINDPGNLGTIIRIADWYGVSQIICSPDTVDCYNPKVLMATMGSFTRVSIWYTDLEKYLSTISGVSVIPGLSRDPAQSRSTESGFLPSQEWQIHIYGAYLDGESTHTKDWWTGWWHLVIGSEAHGISNNLEKYITDKITIPRFGLAESLNAGVATAVILDRMRG